MKTRGQFFIGILMAFLMVTAPVFADEGARVKGDQTVGGQQVVRKQQIIEGDIIVGGGQTVHGPSVMKKDQTVEGDQIVEGAQTVNGAQTIKGDQIVEGESTFTGPVAMARSNLSLTTVLPTSPVDGDRIKTDGAVLQVYPDQGTNIWEFVWCDACGTEGRWVAKWDYTLGSEISQNISIAIVTEEPATPRDNSGWLNTTAETLSFKVPGFTYTTPLVKVADPTPPTQACDVEAQVWAGETEATSTVGYAVGSQWFATKFVASGTNSICAASLALLAEGSPTGTSRVAIYTDNSGTPGVIVGEWSANVDNSTILATESMISFGSLSATLTDTVSYFTVINTSGYSSTNYLKWAHPSTFLSGNNFQSTDGVTWSPANSRRNKFTLYKN